MKKKERFKKDMKASTVIEMSYIMPVFLFLFLLIMYTVFYYHDKAVLNGAAAETAVLGAQAERRKETKEYDLEKIFHERTEGKLIFLTGANVTVQKDEKEITVSVSAQKNLMRLSICPKAAIVNPQQKIRWLS